MNNITISGKKPVLTAKSASYIYDIGFGHTMVVAVSSTSADLPDVSDAAGKADWVNKLNSGVSHQTVLEGFPRSAEFSNIMKSFGL